MKSKAISPMIAVVLLIAFTVAVGGILSLWLTSLSATQTETTGAAAEKQILCSRSVLTIEEVDYSTTANVNITVTYTYGTQDLSNVNIYLIDSLRASYNKTMTDVPNLNPGDTKVYNITGSSLTGSTFQEVTATAMCEDTYPVSTSCTSGQACMSKR